MVTKGNFLPNEIQPFVEKGGDVMENIRSQGKHFITDNNFSKG